MQYAFATGESIYLVDYSDGQLIKKIYFVIQFTPELNSVILVNCFIMLDVRHLSPVYGHIKLWTKISSVNHFGDKSVV